MDRHSAHSSELCDWFPLALTRFVDLFDLVDIIDAAPHHSSLNFFLFFATIRGMCRIPPSEWNLRSHHRHTSRKQLKFGMQMRRLMKFPIGGRLFGGNWKVQCSRRNPVNGLNWTGGHFQLRPFQMRLSVSWRRVSHRLTGQTQVADSKILSKHIEARWRPSREANISLNGSNELLMRQKSLGPSSSSTFHLIEFYWNLITIYWIFLEFNFQFYWI